MNTTRPIVYGVRITGGLRLRAVTHRERTFGVKQRLTGTKL